MGPLVPYISDAKANGFDDVLWLLDDYVKEMTALNIFILQQSRFGYMELITPPQDTCIMNGVTRQTIIDMKDEIEQKFDLKVQERQVSIHEVINSSKEGRLFEIFGGATHCSMLPVQRIVYQDSTIMLKHGQVCKDLCKMVNDAMTGPSQNNKWITPFE